MTAELKPSLFMRIPQVNTGYLVTLEHMEAIAKWCEGAIYGADTPKPYIRIPTTNPGQSRSKYEARLNQWILKTGPNSFTVYSKSYLEKNFAFIPADTNLFEGTVLMSTRVVDGGIRLDETPSAPVIPEQGHTCCHHHPENAHQIPNAPKPTNFVRRSL